MKVPVIRQTSMKVAIIHVLVLAGLVLGIGWGNLKVMLCILVAYYVLVLTLRSIVVPWLGNGLRLTKWKQYEEAIACFQKGYEYLERHPWIDRYRFIITLSSSEFSYREMALCNIAFCYGQMGESETAVLMYEDILEQYPDNTIALMSLNLLRPLLEKAREPEDDSRTF